MPPVREGGQETAEGRGEVPGPPLPWPASPGGDRERLREFLARLERMGSQERIRASRFEFDRWQLNVWAGRYPGEVPLVGGEFEFIARSLVDNE